MIKTTEKQFKLFCRECEKFRNFFSLQDWDILYTWALFSKPLGIAESKIQYLSCDKVVRITLYKYHRGRKKKRDWDIPHNREIKFAAFHEIAHLFLSDLTWYIHDKIKRLFFKRLEEEEHRIIHKLQNIFLDKNGNLKYEK